jgi:hypothetical protein
MDVDGEGNHILDVKDKLIAGSEIEVVSPQGQPLSNRIKVMVNHKSGDQIDVAQPNMTVKAKFATPVSPFDVLRQKVAPGPEPELHA